MNDSPGWASPGSSPSEERPSAAPDPDAATPAAEAATGEPGPKWSKAQPPANQWSAGSGPADPARGWNGPPAGGGAPAGGQGGYGAPGWGGQWAGQWGGPPPAAKPGVIPLRPLGIGEILDGAVSTMRLHWRSVLGLSLAIAMVTQVVVTLMQGFALDGLNQASRAGTTGDAEELVGAIASTAGASAVSQLMTLLGTVLATAMLTVVFSRAVLGRTSSIGGAWQEARPRVLSLCGLTLLVIAMMLATLLVGILPGVLLDSLPLGILGFFASAVVAAWLWVTFLLAPPALMLERQGIITALVRSARLVRGSWWRVFGITLLTGIITTLVASIIVVPFTLLGILFSGSQGLISASEGTTTFGWGYLIVTAVGAVIALTITMPISAGVTVLLYIDQRIRREALDLELVRAAQSATADSTGPTGPTTGG
ncbi:hypothetical protein [Streptomyces sp. NPDC006879]|uniref:hypothetical protein n=1 Tax=Streptomyces sp. NPDC006879 TaxID=3364767 RepID=UPI00367B5A72